MNTEEPRFTEEELARAKEILDVKLQGRMELTEQNALWWLEEE